MDISPCAISSLHRLCLNNIDRNIIHLPTSFIKFTLTLTISTYTFQPDKTLL